MKDQGRRLVPAPVMSDPVLSSAILDVVCGMDEEVEWHWTMTNRGPSVSGYSIIRRLPKLNEFCTSTQIQIDSLQAQPAAAEPHGPTPESVSKRSGPDMQGCGEGAKESPQISRPRNKIPRARARQRRYRGLPRL